VQVVAVMAIIEFGQYWMHRLMHNSTPFWLTHAPHHHITQLNAMKGSVGNPIELFLISLSVVAFFDFSPTAKFCAYSVNAAIAIYAHANVAANPPIFYSFFFTTIRNHSLHHSVPYEDTRCNYGNSLIIWDRVFGTYREGEASVVGQDQRKRLSIWEQTVFPSCRWWMPTRRATRGGRLEARFPAGAAGSCRLAARWRPRAMRRACSRKAGSTARRPPNRWRRCRRWMATLCHPPVDQDQFRGALSLPLFGHDRALLVDTGAQGGVIRPVVDRLVQSWLAAHHRKSIPLVVAHSHSGDHIAADDALRARPDTVVVGTQASDVASFFHIACWPEGIGRFDLGGRVISVIPTPGHQKAAAMYYDPRLQILLSGDLLYPGRPVCAGELHGRGARQHRPRGGLCRHPQGACPAGRAYRDDAGKGPRLRARGPHASR
jgi:hypothetical protein